jgi:hypothetical protein
MLLFSGYSKAYGTYGVELTEEGGKQKGLARSLKGDVTIELWYAHLMGKQGLGIIPIDESSRAKFAAIDIDEYPIDHVKLAQDIARLNLPLVCCRTKSGGAHLFLFLESFTDAKLVHQKIRDMAALLGYGNSEIFPKQTKIVAERGDVGNWINMPYFNMTETTRYAYDNQGKILGFTEFMVFARSKIVDQAFLMGVKHGDEEILPGGPPCLNHLLHMGFPAGTRNNGLFNLAVYAKKAYGDDWQQYVQEYNGKYMDPPLDASEVQGLCKSVEKKEFQYSCKSAPICNYCNMPRCRTKKHGIGVGSLGMPKFGSLTKLMTIPPIWFLEVESGGRLELTTDELQSPRLFQNRCMEALNTMPILPKMDEWQEIMAKLLSEVNEVEVPVEATPAGQLWQLLEDFCTSRVRARNASELLLGKPWDHDGTVYFRMKDFMEFLDRRKFRMEMQSVASNFRHWKMGYKAHNIERKCVNTYFIVAERFQHFKGDLEQPLIVDPKKVLT